MSLPTLRADRRNPQARDGRPIPLTSARSADTEAKVRELGVRLVHIPCAQSVSPRRPLRFLRRLPSSSRCTLKSACEIPWFRPSVGDRDGRVFVRRRRRSAPRRWAPPHLPPGAERPPRRRERVPRAVRGTRRARRSRGCCASAPQPRGVFVGYPVRSKDRDRIAERGRRALRRPGRRARRLRRGRAHGVSPHRSSGLATTAAARTSG